MTALQVLIPHRADVKIESVVVSQDYLVVFQRIEGLQVSTPFSVLYAPGFCHMHQYCAV